MNYRIKLGFAVVSLAASLFVFLQSLSLADLPTQIPIAAGNDVPTVNAFYMSDTPVGNDANDCKTVATPCLTIAHMVTIMQASPTIKTTFVMASGGQFNIGTRIDLTSTANNLTFKNYPGDTPVFDGGGTLTTIFNATSVTGLTMQGLTCQNTTTTGTTHRACMEFHTGSGNIVKGNLFTNTGDGLMIDAESSDLVTGNQFTNAGNGDANNGTCTPVSGGSVPCGGSAIELENTTTTTTVSYNAINGAASINTHGGCVFAHGLTNSTITHNVCENTSGMGIGILDFSVSSENSGNTVSYNLISNTNTNSNDSGCIYSLARNLPNVSPTSFDHNYCSAPTSRIGTQIRELYADDCTSNSTWTNNIVWNGGVNTGGTGGSAIEIHVGSNNTFSNNILNIGQNITSVVLAQNTGGTGVCSTTMAGNTWTNNIATSTQAGTQNFTSSITGQLAITGAQLWRAGGAWNGTSGASGFTYSGVTTAVDPGFTSPAGITLSAACGATLGNWTASAALAGWNPIDTSIEGIAGSGVPTVHWNFVC